MYKPTSARFTIVVWGLLIAGLLACGGGSATQAITEAPATQASGQASMPSIDPCAILTQDDASAFFGAPSVAGRPSDISPGDTTAFCIYATADNTGSLSLNLRYAANGALNDDEFVTLKSVNQDVPGLGEGAYFDPQVHLLTVAKGPWIVRVSGTIQAAIAPLEKLMALAQAALGRLP